MDKKRIAILMHEDAGLKPTEYLISILANYWQEDGHEIIYLWGTDQFVHADLLFVHVDLSVVPNLYLQFANQYPIVVNGKVRDIRKSKYSQGLLHQGDNWEGSVIVKSNENYAGRPERKRKRYNSIKDNIRHEIDRFVKRLNLSWIKPFFDTPLDYPIYDNLKEVPRPYFYHPQLVVQKFFPEKEDNLYCVRMMFFLGDHLNCIRLKGNHPIVNSMHILDVEPNIEPHPQIVSMRKRLKFDYGKFDYVVVDGQPILLDTNKTIGRPVKKLASDSEMDSHLKHYANGLYSYFE